MTWKLSRNRTWFTSRPSWRRPSWLLSSLCSSLASSLAQTAGGANPDVAVLLQKSEEGVKTFGTPFIAFLVGIFGLALIVALGAFVLKIISGSEAR